MPNIGGPELIIVLIIFILLFGAKKLPDLGSSVGKSIKNFKKGLDEGGREDQSQTGAQTETEVPPATQTSRDSS